jgi:hypothetical protein
MLVEVAVMEYLGTYSVLVPVKVLTLYLGGTSLIVEKGVYGSVHAVLKREYIIEAQARQYAPLSPEDSLTDIPTQRNFETLFASACKTTSHKLTLTRSESSLGNGGITYER